MILDEMVRKVNGLDRLSPFCTKIKPYGDRKWYYLINILTSYYSTPNVHKFTKTQCAEIINNFYNKNPKILMNIETSII